MLAQTTRGHNAWKHSADPDSLEHGDRTRHIRLDRIESGSETVVDSLSDAVAESGMTQAIPSQRGQPNRRLNFLTSGARFVLGGFGSAFWEMEPGLRKKCLLSPWF